MDESILLPKFLYVPFSVLQSNLPLPHTIIIAIIAQFADKKEGCPFSDEKLGKLINFPSDLITQIMADLKYNDLIISKTSKKGFRELWVNPNPDPKYQDVV